MIKKTINKQKDTKFLYYGELFTAIRSKVSPYYANTRRNPLWLLMFLIGRFQIVRSLVTWISKRSRAENDCLSSSSFPELKVDDVVSCLKQDGIYLGLRLPKQFLQELLNFANSNHCYGDGNYSCGFLYAEKDTAIQQYGKPFVRGEYYNTAVLCPAIKKLANDPKLLEIATKYLGKTPVFTSSRLHWIFTVPEAGYDFNKGAMNFHYDLMDYCSLRFFFYLTDVDLLSGPHICFRGSHKRKKFNYLLSLSRRQSEAELLDYYGFQKSLTVCGSAGFGFAEDPFCFHKAVPPISQDRLLLQIQFALYDYGDQTVFVNPALLERCLPS
ncbi:hypothetical protein [Fischerella sp. PCC 9605]|uniref:hypothetical protein n=1 Tax=Fischerella sp. PCC 9605 TaxID=1173024 RepID=UPI0004AF5465|nr:hypothetical protein [Fischerella sp. PCC 9605]